MAFHTTHKFDTQFGRERCACGAWIEDVLDNKVSAFCRMPWIFKLIERVSRAMCKADGNDPDAKCLRRGMTELVHLGGLGAGARYAPQDLLLVPAWSIYVPAAETTMLHLEAAAMEPFVARYIEEKSVERTPWWPPQGLKRAWAAEVVHWDTVGSKCVSGKSASQVIVDDLFAPPSYTWVFPFRPALPI